jgi:hypothetical protein
MGITATSAPGGVDERPRRGSASWPVIDDMQPREWETRLTADRQHPPRGHRGAVRQHARQELRTPLRLGTSHPTAHKKTPGAPTPDVLESRWDVWIPDLDRIVAKR